jgi:putative ABC transport system permease protein
MAVRGVRIGRVPALWRKAPAALFHHRSVLVAVFVAALLAALASSSSPFVTTAAASEALKNKLADLSPYATGLEIETVTQLFGAYSSARLESDARARVRAVDRLRGRVLHVGTPLYTTELSAHVAGPNGDSEVALMSRTAAIEHVKVLNQVSGPGVWVADITAADAGGLHPGDIVRLDGLESSTRPQSPRVRIKGIYRALAHSPETDYWGNLYQEIYPQGVDGDVPPPYVFMDQSALFRLVGGRNATIQTKIDLPVDPHSLTLTGARTLDRQFSAVRSGSSLGQQLGCTQRVLTTGPGAAGLRACTVTSSLSAAVTLADRNASAVTPAVTLLSDLGTGIALGVAAAAGIFLVRRRRAETALLYARGEHVGVFAARSALEALLPTLAGGALGFALAYLLTAVFAPSGSISSATVWSGAAHGAVAVAAAVVVLVACAAVSFLHLYDTGVRGTRRLRWLPWEAALLAAALVLYLRIRSGGAVTHGAAHAPTLAVFVFPLLLVAAVAGVAARLARVGIGLGSAHARGRRPAVYLALRRLAAARGLVVVLAVVTAASLGAFFYVETLAASLHHTTLEKAYTATGSDASAIVQDSQQLPRDFDYPITRVQFANQAASTVDGSPVDVMLVDPATLSRTLHWQGGWGPDPARSVDELARAPSAPLPVIVTRDLAGDKAILIGGVRVPTHVLASVHGFPFMAEGIPLVITSYRALDAFEARTKMFDSLGVLNTYIWGKGPPAQVGRALTGFEPTYPPSTIDTYLRAPDVVLATRTFTFMRMIAIGVGVLALVGLLLYLQARQRSQAIASALARRMGLTRGAELLSLCLEVAAILSFAAVIGGGVAIASAAPVVHRIDPLPQDPPSPIFTVPVGEVVLAALALVVVAVAAGALTSWFARRTDVSEALRVA